MWVKKCSELSISAVSEETTLHLHFLLSSHSTLLILLSLKPSSHSCSVSGTFFLHSAVPGSAGAIPIAFNPSSSAKEEKKMAVAGCPDYFLHHPNYQVRGHLLFDFFLCTFIIKDIIACDLAYFFNYYSDGAQGVVIYSF